MIILKRIFKKYDGAWAGLILFRIRERQKAVSNAVVNLLIP
jgi:hypothetical protein